MLEEAIVKLLNADRQVAYASSEISALFHQSTERVELVLDTLTEKNAVLGRMVGSRQAYYAAP